VMSFATDVGPISTIRVESACTYRNFIYDMKLMLKQQQS